MSSRSKKIQKQSSNYNKGNAKKNNKLKIALIVGVIALIIALIVLVAVLTAEEDRYIEGRYENEANHITFSSNGSFAGSIGDEALSGTYTINGNTVKFTFNDVTQTGTLSNEDNTLTAKLLYQAHGDHGHYNDIELTKKP